MYVYIFIYMYIYIYKYIYIYIYIYMCVCVRVCVCYLNVFVMEQLTQPNSKARIKPIDAAKDNRTVLITEAIVCTDPDSLDSDMETELLVVT